MENLGKKWWIVYADYAWGKQNNAVLTEVEQEAWAAPCSGSTPYPLGSAEFSAHLPKIQAAKPEVLVSVTPGADNIAFLKQVLSFGMRSQMKIAQPLHWISVAKQGGPELYDGIYAGINWYWELQDSIPRPRSTSRPPEEVRHPARRLQRLRLQRRAGSRARRRARPRRRTPTKVADALRKNPTYDHFKGKQWWRACDNKSFQDMWIVKGRGPGKAKGDWGLLEVVAACRPARSMDRTCAEKGHA